MARHRQEPEPRGLAIRLGNQRKRCEGAFSGGCQLCTRARALNSGVAEIDEKRREMRLIGRTRAGTCNYPSGSDAPISHRIVRLGLGEELCASELAEASSRVSNTLSHLPIALSTAEVQSSSTPLNHMEMSFHDGPAPSVAGDRDDRTRPPQGRGPGSGVVSHGSRP